MKANALIYDESMMNSNSNETEASDKKQNSIVQPPKMTYIERKRMKNNMKMALATMQQDDDKAAIIETRIEQSIKIQEETEKILKQDVNNQKEAFQKRLIQRKRSRAASAGMNNSFSFSLSHNKLDCELNQLVKPIVGSSALQMESPVKVRR